MNEDAQRTLLGRGIEEQSFAIIDAEVGEHPYPAREWHVVRRVIHATADVELGMAMAFGHGAIDAGTRALGGGAAVIVDVKMIVAGLSEPRLAARGCRVHGFISDDDVIAAAVEGNTTRAVEAMRKAHRLGLLDGAVVAIGNAPTALFEVLRLAREQAARPALVVGVPVGFVAAAESKDALIASGLPFVAARGRKGGSAVAVAILHALLALSSRSPGGAP